MPPPDSQLMEFGKGAAEFATHSKEGLTPVLAGPGAVRTCFSTPIDATVIQSGWWARQERGRLRGAGRPCPRTAANRRVNGSLRVSLARCAKRVRAVSFPSEPDPDWAGYPMTDDAEFRKARQTLTSAERGRQQTVAVVR